MSTRLPTPLAEHAGRDVTVRAQLWPRNRPFPPGVVEIADPSRKDPPVVSVLVEIQDKRGVRSSSLVHGYGCACAEEVELWEHASVILVGLGQAVVLLDARTGQSQARVPMGGYFNCLWVSEDGRDAFVCGDELVARLVPPGTVSWKRTVGVDGVMVHRAVGINVFVSAQRRVGGPWVDFLLDRTSGSVLEAPESEEEDAQETPRGNQPTRQGSPTWKGKKARKPQTPGDDEDPDNTDEDSDAVRLVRDDETDPDDEE